MGLSACVAATRRSAAVPSAVFASGLLLAVIYVVLWTRSSVLELSGPRAGAEVLVGLAWFACAALVLWMRPGSSAGRLLALGGFLWMVSVARLSSSSWLFTLASAVSTSYLAVGLHLALALPDGVLRARGDRAIVGVAYAAAVVMGPLWALTDAECEEYLPGCPGSLVVVPGLAARAGVVLVVQQVVLPVVAGAALVLLLRRLRHGDAVTRRAAVPVLVVGVVTVPVFLLVLVDQATPSLVDAAYYTAVGLLPVAVVLGLVWARLRRTAVGPLVRALDQGVGSGGLQQALARSLGDPGLRVLFPDGHGGQVDPEGQAPGRPAEHDRVVTPVRRDGQIIALLEHHRAVLDDPELLASAVAASRLALDNARLTAQVRAQLAELRASRRRVVTSVDAARRRLERDLHDGAQQELLSVAISLGQARQAAQQGNTPQLLGQLDLAAGRLEAALTELRRLARGIHPAILTERGLAAAVEALADRAHLPVEVRAAGDGRLPAAVESTAYFVVSEALTNASRYSHARLVTVQLTREPAALLVEVRDDGCGGAQIQDGGGLQGLADRVAAEDGSLAVASQAGHGTVVRAELPLTGPRSELGGALTDREEDQ